MNVTVNPALASTHIPSTPRTIKKSSLESSFNQLKTNRLPKLKLSKSAKSTVLTNQIKEYIIEELQSVPNYDTMSYDFQLMKFIMLMIENLEGNDLDPKLDKKAIFLEIVKTVFPNHSTEVFMLLDNFADFAVSEKLVSKVTKFDTIIDNVKDLKKKIC